MSFFGYDTSKAANPKNIVIDLDGDDLDKALESKYALGQEELEEEEEEENNNNNNNIIQEEEEENNLNNETFGVAAHESIIIGRRKY